MPSHFPPTRMRDSDDYLTARAANPRTGMISPSLAPSSPIATTPATPAEALRLFIPPNHKMSGDRFVVRMPTAREPQPYSYPGFSADDIEEFERSRQGARGSCRSAGSQIDSERRREMASTNSATDNSKFATQSSTIARRPVASPLQPRMAQKSAQLQPQPRSRSFLHDRSLSFFLTTLAKLCEAIRILYKDDSTPQQKLTALKTGLWSIGIVVVVLLLAWHVCCILAHVLEMVLWPLLVVLGVLRVSR